MRYFKIYFTTLHGINDYIYIEENMALTEQEMLEELQKYDTPSITNVVATYPGSPLCLGLYNPWTEKLVYGYLYKMYVS